MAKQHGGRRESLCARSADIIARQLFEHRSADHARQNRGQSSAERGGRKDVISETSSTGNRKHSDLDRKNQNQHGTESEIRHCESKKGEETDRSIGGLSATVCRENARRNCDQRAYRQREKREAQRRGVT